MRECRTYGSARGVGGNAHPYRDISGATDHEWIGISFDQLTVVHAVQVRTLKSVSEWQTSYGLGISHDISNE